MKKKFKNKKLIVFDLDGTLAPTKSKVDKIMAGLLARLLEKNKVAVIGGGQYALFKIQLLSEFKIPNKLLKNLFLFPTTATSFYRYREGWKKIYSLELSKRDRRRIKEAFKKAFKIIKYVQPARTYGKVVEDRKTQVTFSALGQDVVKILGGKKGVALKLKWRDENTPIKLKLVETMRKLLPDLEVGAAGYTSVDITRKGIDKAYGLRQIGKRLGVRIKDMLFVGDAIFPGGNDYAIVRTGVDYVKVNGPKDAEKIIKFLLKNNG